MLERLFKTDSTPCRLRDGPAGPFLDGFAGSMLAAGYSSRTVGSYVHDADHLGQWAGRRGVAVADFDEDLLARFVRHLLRCRCRGWDAVPAGTIRSRSLAQGPRIPW